VGALRTGSNFDQKARRRTKANKKPPFASGLVTWFFEGNNSMSVSKTTPRTERIQVSFDDESELLKNGG
jgi:hypothetical protein